MEATIMFTFTSHVNHESYEAKVQRLVHVPAHQTEKGATKKFEEYLEAEFDEWGHVDGNNGNEMRILNITNKTLL
jgi:hypothetical protein